MKPFNVTKKRGWVKIITPSGKKFEIEDIGLAMRDQYNYEAKHQVFGTLLSWEVELNLVGARALVKHIGIKTNDPSDILGKKVSLVRNGLYGTAIINQIELSTRNKKATRITMIGTGGIHTE